VSAFSDVSIDNIVMDSACIGQAQAWLYFSNLGLLNEDSLVAEVFLGSLRLTAEIIDVSQKPTNFSDSILLQFQIPYLNMDDSLRITITAISGIPDINSVNNERLIRPAKLKGITSNLPDSVLACNGNTVVLEPGNFVSYLWSNGSTASTYTSAGNEIVSVQLTSQDGCSFYDTSYIGIGTGAQLDLSADTQICRNTLLVIPQSNFISSYWNSTNTEELWPKQSGIYRMSATDKFLCFSTDSIQVDIAPNAELQLDSLYHYCAGESITIDAGTFASYSWSNGNSTRKVTFNKPGKYGLQVAESGCFESKSFTVVEVPLPNPAIIQKSYDTLYTHDTADYSFQWYMDGSPILGATDTFYVMQQNGS